MPLARSFVVWVVWLDWIGSVGGWGLLWAGIVVECL